MKQSEELKAVIRQIEALSPTERGQLRAWLAQVGNVVPMDRRGEVGKQAVNSAKG